MSNPKVKILKEGIWSINPPHPGELYVFEGEVRDDIDQCIVDRMLASDTKHIEILEKGASDEPEETDGITVDNDIPHVLDDVSDIRAVLLDIVDNADNKNDAKNKLEVWARDALAYEVDKRRSMENVIADIITEYEEQNG